ncbi:MAG: HAD-IA family hydrolase [Patescibacteria group bacterium]
MIKAIFFDSGDVIVREGFNPGIVEYEKKYSLLPGSLYKSAHDRQYWKDFTLGNISENEYFADVADDYKKAKIDTTDFKKIIQDNFKLNEELLDFLMTIKNKFILGVISNHPKEFFEWCRQYFGWDKIFTVYAVSGDLHVRKPDKRIFDYAVKKAGVAGGECIYVDNRSDRIEGAQLAGMQVIIYQNINQLKTDLSNFINVTD